jgi:hypothetical protein
MIGSRARHSLAQFLELQESAVSIVMFSKYGVQHLSLSPAVKSSEDATVAISQDSMNSTAWCGLKGLAGATLRPFSWY